MQEENGLDFGLCLDEPSQLMPPGSVRWANDFLFDKPHMARKRGGTTAVFSGAQTAFGQYIGALYADSQVLTGAGTLRRVYTSRAIGGSAIHYWNTSTGAATQLGTLTVAGVQSSPTGRPFQHGRFLIFPGQTGSAIVEGPAYVAGADGTGTNLTGAHAASATVTALSSTITIGGGDVTTSLKAGMIALFESANYSYIGAVVAIPSSTSIVVDPVPTVSFTPSSFSIMNFSFMANLTKNASNTFTGGAVGCSWQQRILFADVSFENTTTGRKERRSNRIIYSVLPDEANSFSTTGGANGAIYLSPDGYPDLNYIDLPAQEKIVALIPTPAGDLLVFSQTAIYKLTGTLVTQTATSGGGQVTFDLKQVVRGMGALNERSIQITPRGIVFASTGGVYSYTGSAIVNLMQDRVQSIWRSQGTAPTIYGAAVIRDHYIVYPSLLSSLSAPNAPSSSPAAAIGLICNLNTLAWSTIGGGSGQTSAVMMFDSIVSPADPSIVYGLRHWDETGGAPSMTNGQIVRLETIFQPSSSTINDSDGNAVSAALQSRSFNLGAPAAQVLWRRGNVRINQDSTGSSGPSNSTLQAQARSDIDTGYTNSTSVIATASLSNTKPVALSAATNASPIVITTTANHGIVSGAQVLVAGVTGNTAANGVWRVTASSGTTLTLIGSTGNGTFGGTAYVALVSRDMIDLSPLAESDAMDYTIVLSQTVRTFEVLGFTAQGLARHPVNAL